MQTNTIINVMGSIVLVSAVFVVVSNPNSASVIRSFGDAFSSSIRASIGR